MPLLTLGIPTSATAAVMLTAFESYGLQPGPTLFTEQGTLVWTLIASLYIGNVILLILNLPLVGLWVRLLRIPAPWLYAGIIVISAAGVYGSSQSVFDLLLLFGFGLLGFAFRRFDFPAAPLVIGLILGPIAEQSLRQALTISMGSYTTFVTRPLSATLLTLAALLLLLPAFLRWREGRGEAPARHTAGRPCYRRNIARELGDHRFYWSLTHIDLRVSIYHGRHRDPRRDDRARRRTARA
jgi:putative tricarboxylic transport membrane protein